MGQLLERQTMTRIAALATLIFARPAVAQDTSPVRTRVRQIASTRSHPDHETKWQVKPAHRTPRPFQILVWQFKNDAIRDRALYDEVYLSGWHIDRGAGLESRAAWADQHQRPFYIDHAAGKGILHLTDRSGLSDIPRNGKAAPRPWPLLEAATWTELKTRLDRNLPAVVNEQTVAVALDDEVSLGLFNSPLETGFGRTSRSAFADWLTHRYASTPQLQRAWNDSDVSFATAEPVTFHEVRQQITNQTPDRWRLAPWMNFRTFMDQQQAATFAALTDEASHHAPGVPIGVVGAQQPSVYGGFDYSLLRHSVQWMEAYDIGATNELLHSFWSRPPRPSRIQTFFASGQLRQDKWFLWYYLAHGCTGVIAWPDIGGKAWFDGQQIHPAVRNLADTFRELQKPELQVLAHPQTTPEFSDIAILYAHHSIQVGWAIDASAHGSTWPRRSSSLDNNCLSSGKNRVAWTRLLEDLGHQAKFIDTTDLVAGELTRPGTKVLILPQCFALSRNECEAIRNFVVAGGTVIADYGTAITDENGTGYANRPLDDLFGITRTDEQGWFDGKRRYEINGEQYREPLQVRLPSAGCRMEQEMPVAERSIADVRLSNRIGKGRAVFLNLSPTAYCVAQQRSGRFGDLWRHWIGDSLSDAGVNRRLWLERMDGRKGGIELLRYRTANGDTILVVVTNPVRQQKVDGAATGLRLEQDSIEVTLHLQRGAESVVDIRTGRSLIPQNKQLPLSLPPDEAILLRMKTQ